MQHTKEEMRKRLTEAALDEFCRKGYQAASIRTIVHEAGTSLGNLYRYFENKEALFRALADPVTDRCIASTREVFDISSESIGGISKMMVAYFDENRRVFDVIMGGPPEYYADFLKRFSDCISERLMQYCTARLEPERLKIKNPDFFNAVAAGYISGLQRVMESRTDSATTEERAEELLLFVFGDFDRRLYALSEGK